MQVIDLANDLRVSAEGLVHLLREMGIPVADPQSEVVEADVSRILARLERERRAGHKDSSEALDAAIEDAQATHAPRRRRRRSAPTKEVEVEAAEGDEAGSEAEASEDAASQVGSEVDSGGGESLEQEAELEHEVEVAATASSEEKDHAEVEFEATEGMDIEVVGAAGTEAEDQSSDQVMTDVAEDAGVDSEPEPSADSGDLEGGEATVEALPAEKDTVEPAQKPEPVRRSAPDGPVRVIRKPTPAPAASAGPGGQVRIQAEGYTSDGKKKDKKDKKGKKRARVDQTAVQSNIQRVMTELKVGGGGKKRRRGKGSVPSKEDVEAAQEEVRQEEERERTTVRVNEFLTVAELGELIDTSSSEIIGSAFKNMGMMVTINQRLDFDQIELLCEEFDFTAVLEEDYAAEEASDEPTDNPEDLLPRAPVVTVMGHVDHGKTKLLDHIRSTNVVAGEAGGITQHIGAYHVGLPGDRTITFLDTPGHAAFTAMRARGADVTDIVILVVAADDSVMPQTIEAISHAKNAGVPVVVAINKVDLPGVNPGKVRQELLQHGLTLEEFGGDVLSAEVSALKGTGVDDLLEKVLLQADMLELKANPNREANGSVVEARLDVGKGPVVTVLVQGGTLRVGDSFICGLFDGRVRAMLDERGKTITSAGPGVPVQILGSSGVPQAGDAFTAMDPVKASEKATNRQRLEREKQLRIKERGFKLGDFSKLLAAGQVGTLPLIIKGDVDGSVQALADSLEQLSNPEVRVEIIHRAVGAINESDVILAGPAKAVIIGFRVRPDLNARTLADREGVDIHHYDVIYEAVDQVKAALEGMLAPERREKIVGTAEVRDLFRITKVGTIAGCYISHGNIQRAGRARLIRNGIVVYDGDFSSLKRFKDDVKEVREGFECGIGIHNFNDVKVGDVIECYLVEEVARTLAQAGASRK